MIIDFYSLLLLLRWGKRAYKIGSMRVRKAVKNLLGEENCEMLRNIRATVVGVLLGLKEKSRFLFSTVPMLVLNYKIYPLLCDVFYKAYISKSIKDYFYLEEDMISPLGEISSYLDSLKGRNRPLILGPHDGHHSIRPVTFESIINFNNRNYWKLFLYSPSPIQELMKSKFGYQIETLLGSRPFFLTYRSFVCILISLNVLPLMG